MPRRQSGSRLHSMHDGELPAGAHRGTRRIETMRTSWPHVVPKRPSMLLGPSFANFFAGLPGDGSSPLKLGIGTRIAFLMLRWWPRADRFASAAMVLFEFPRDCERMVEDGSGAESATLDWQAGTRRARSRREVRRPRVA